MHTRIIVAVLLLIATLAPMPAQAGRYARTIGCWKVGYILEIPAGWVPRYPECRRINYVFGPDHADQLIISVSQHPKAMSTRDVQGFVASLVLLFQHPLRVAHYRSVNINGVIYQSAVFDATLKDLGTYLVAITATWKLKRLYEFSAIIAVQHDPLVAAKAFNTIILL